MKGLATCVSCVNDLVDDALSMLWKIAQRLATQSRIAEIFAKTFM